MSALDRMAAAVAHGYDELPPRPDLIDRLVRIAATARGVPDDVIRLEVGLDPQEPRP